MASSMKYVLTLAIIAAVACSAYGLQCYVCDSHRDSKCGEKFDAQNHFKQDCSRLTSQIQNFNLNALLPRNATGCKKSLFNIQGGHPRIERSCFFGDVHQTAQGCAPDLTHIATQQQLLSCDVCTGNLCNGSGMLTPIGLAIAIFFVVARIFS